MLPDPLRTGVGCAVVGHAGRLRQSRSPVRGTRPELQYAVDLTWRSDWADALFSRRRHGVWHLVTQQSVWGRLVRLGMVLSTPASSLSAADDEFQVLCFEYGIELDDVVGVVEMEEEGGLYMSFGRRRRSWPFSAQILPLPLAASVFSNHEYNIFSVKGFRTHLLNSSPPNSRRLSVR